LGGTQDAASDSRRVGRNITNLAIDFLWVGEEGQVCENGFIKNLILSRIVSTEVPYLTAYLIEITVVRCILGANALLVGQCGAV